MLTSAYVENMIIEHSITQVTLFKKDINRYTTGVVNDYKINKVPNS